MYQAQTGTTLSVTFPDDVEVDVAAVQEALAGVDYQATVNQIGDGPSFEIGGPYLSPEPRETVRLALVESIGEPTEFVNSDLPPPTSDQMDGVLDIISRRVNLYGTEEPIVQRFGDDRIIVQLPGASGSVVTVQFSDAADVEKLSSVVDGRGYGDTEVVVRGNNERRITTENTLSVDQREQLRAVLEAEVGPVEAYQVTGGIEDAKRLIGETAQLEFLRRKCAGPVAELGCLPPFADSSIGLTGDDLVDAYASTDTVTGQWVVNIQFNGPGRRNFQPDDPGD